MSAQDDYLTIRIDPDLKAALQAAAEREGRTMGNLVKHLIREYCGPMPTSVRQEPRPYRVRRKKK